MDDRKYVAYMDLDGKVLVDGEPVEEGRWYHITITWDEPNWWQRLKRKLLLRRR